MKPVFRQLCAQFCDLAGIDPPPWQGDGPLTTLPIEYEGVSINLAFNDACPDTLLVIGTLGQPASAPQAELAATRTLLEANYYLLGRSPVMFSRHPRSGDILLQYARPLSECSAHLLRDSMANLAQLARCWTLEGPRMEPPGATHPMHPSQLA